jgi:hypothetical protein
MLPSSRCSTLNLRSCSSADARASTGSAATPLQHRSDIPAAIAESAARMRLRHSASRSSWKAGFYLAPLGGPRPNARTTSRSPEAESYWRCELRPAPPRRRSLPGPPDSLSGPPPPSSRPLPAPPRSVLGGLAGPPLPTSCAGA